MKKILSTILAVFIISSFGVNALAQGNDLLLCRNAIDLAFQSYIYGTLSESSTETEEVELDDLGFLTKVESLYSTDIPTSKLIQEAITYLRELNTEMEKNCSLLRNNLRVPIELAQSRRIIECANREFTADETLNLSLYCSEQKTFYIDYLKDHIRSITLRDAQQKQASKIVKKYQEINIKLRTLSESLVRMVQYISKFNAALGKIITGTCQQ